MRCLTIWQPFASAVACGLKGWETRSQPTRYRGKVAIHAARPEAKAPPGHPVWGHLVSDDGCTLIDELRPLVFSAIVAVADLTACIPVKEGTVELAYEPPHPCIVPHHGTMLTLYPDDSGHGEDIDDQRPFGPWEPGSWAWRLKRVRRLPEPIPARGRLGLWNPHGCPLPGDSDGDLQAEIERALETVA